MALENWDLDANREMPRSMHDLLVWQREMKTMEEIGAFRTAGWEARIRNWELRKHYKPTTVLRPRMRSRPVRPTISDR